MADEARTTLQLDEPDNLRPVRREWMAERIGWVVIAVLLTAALLGLLGPGPLSERTQACADGRLSVEYYAIERSEKPATLRILVKPARSEEYVRLGLSHTFTEEVSFENIVPEPEWMEMEDTRVVYVFRVADVSDSGLITCRYRYDEFGWMGYQVGLVDGSEIDVEQFVCP